MKVVMKKTYVYEPLCVDHLGVESFRPAHLLDHLQEILELDNDAQLSRELEIPPNLISRLRNKKLSLTPAILLRIHDAAGLPINNIRDVIGLPISKYG